MIFRSPTVILYDVDGNPVEVATEATLATLASESKLEAVRLLLVGLASEDFATEAKLEAVRALLQTLTAEDFATEATLAGVKIGTDRIPASPAQEHVGAASPHATRLSDGVTFYKATTPADTQPVSASSLPLPAGAASETTLVDVLTELEQKTEPTDQQHTIVDSSALPAGAATEATLAGIKAGTDKIPALPAQEHATATSPHATRLTDGAAFYKATTPADTQPISASSLPLPSGAATESSLLKFSRGEARYHKRFDIGATTIYTGYAPNGTSPNVSGWTIKRMTLDGSGNPTAEEWTTEGAAIWDNRTSESYS